MGIESPPLDLNLENFFDEKLNGWHDGHHDWKKGDRVQGGIIDTLFEACRQTSFSSELDKYSKSIHENCNPTRDDCHLRIRLCQLTGDDRDNNERYRNFMKGITQTKRCVFSRCLGTG